MQNFNEMSNEELEQFDLLLKSYSTFQNLEAKLPKVNFKRVKLGKLQSLDKNLTTIIFDDTSLDLPIKREVESESSVQSEGYSNPLRKKGEPKPDIKPQVEIETRKDVTFNVSAQIVQSEEDLIISPSTAVMPPFEEVQISTSGESPSAYVWPPVQQKKSKKSKTTKSKKPYFISDESELKKTAKAEPQETKTPEVKKTEPKKEDLSNLFEERISLEEHNKEIEEIHSASFPWASTEVEQVGVEDIFHGGLESELVDSAEENEIKFKSVEAQDLEKKEEDQPQSENINDFYKNQFTASVEEQSTVIPVIRAIKPDIPKDLQDETTKNFDNGIELQMKGSKMFDNYQNDRLGPLKIVILGGLTATLLYLAWGYLVPSMDLPNVSTEGNKEKIVVRDLFNKKSISSVKKEDFISGLFNKNNKIPLGNEGANEITEAIVSEDPDYIQPITEKDRLALILMARDAIENRFDPFGQEAVLPPPPEKKEVPEAEKPKPDIQLQRKQVELVGVISTKDKNLALVNVYTADYAVKPEDDKETREAKLKTSLGMSVPNRIEASLFDPIEDWYVKQIVKSKSRNEDPTIDLVKGDKKFKLRVGQKVLLPDERKLLEASLEEDSSGE